MARTPRVPKELKNAPFTLAEARRHGLTPSALRGKAWKRIGAELYCWRDLQQDPWALLAAWARTLPTRMVFARSTAAWILGLELDRGNPIEVDVPTLGVRSRPGLSVRHCQISPRDVRTIRGLRTTTLHRTLRDLCATKPALDALIAIDTALHLHLTDMKTLAAASKGGGHGAPRLASLAKIAALAESPMETRLRWLLLDAGLPRPEVQIDLLDASGEFVGRADLFYRQARLVIEYDGGTHRERLVDDDRRQNLVLNAGFHMLRFTAADVYQRPAVVAAQVRSALLAQDGRNSGRRSAVAAQERRNGRLLARR